MTGKFGWSYPPGAATDPTAPYNQPPEPVFDCETCGTSYSVEDCDEGELQGKRGDGLTVPYHCPECGDVIANRLIDEPVRR